jgi:hypothetical protein
MDKLRQKAYFIKNKERILSYQKTYYETNKTNIKKYNRNYYIMNIRDKKIEERLKNKVPKKKEEPKPKPRAKKPEIKMTFETENFRELFILKFD